MQMQSTPQSAEDLLARQFQERFDALDRRGDKVAELLRRPTEEYREDLQAENQLASASAEVVGNRLPQSSSFCSTQTKCNPAWTADAPTFVISQQQHSAARLPGSQPNLASVHSTSTAAMGAVHPSPSVNNLYHHHMASSSSQALGLRSSQQQLPPSMQQGAMTASCSVLNQQPGPGGAPFVSPQQLGAMSQEQRAYLAHLQEGQNVAMSPRTFSRRPPQHSMSFCTVPPDLSPRHVDSSGARVGRPLTTRPLSPVRSGTMSGATLTLQQRESASAQWRQMLMNPPPQQSQPQLAPVLTPEDRLRTVSYDSNEPEEEDAETIAKRFAAVRSKMDDVALSPPKNVERAAPLMPLDKAAPIAQKVFSGLRDFVSSTAGTVGELLQDAVIVAMAEAPPEQAEDPFGYAHAQRERERRPSPSPQARDRQRETEGKIASRTASSTPTRVDDVNTTTHTTSVSFNWKRNRKKKTEPAAVCEDKRVIDRDAHLKADNHRGKRSDGDGSDERHAQYDMPGNPHVPINPRSERWRSGERTRSNNVPRITVEGDESKGYSLVRPDMGSNGRNGSAGPRQRSAQRNGPGSQMAQEQEDDHFDVDYNFDTRGRRGNEFADELQASPNPRGTTIFAKKDQRNFVNRPSVATVLPPQVNRGRQSDAATLASVHTQLPANYGRGGGSPPMHSRQMSPQGGPSLHARRGYVDPQEQMRRSDGPNRQDVRPSERGRRDMVIGEQPEHRRTDLQNYGEPEPIDRNTFISARETEYDPERMTIDKALPYAGQMPGNVRNPQGYSAHGGIAEEARINERDSRYDRRDRTATGSSTQERSGSLSVERTWARRNPALSSSNVSPKENRASSVDVGNTGPMSARSARSDRSCRSIVDVDAESRLQMNETVPNAELTIPVGVRRTVTIDSKRSPGGSSNHASPKDVARQAELPTRSRDFNEAATDASYDARPVATAQHSRSSIVTGKSGIFTGAEEPLFLEGQMKVNVRRDDTFAEVTIRQSELGLDGFSARGDRSVPLSNMAPRQNGTMVSAAETVDNGVAQSQPSAVPVVPKEESGSDEAEPEAHWMDIIAHEAPADEEPQREPVSDQEEGDGSFRPVDNATVQPQGEEKAAKRSVYFCSEISEHGETVSSISKVEADSFGTRGSAPRTSHGTRFSQMSFPDKGNDFASKWKNFEQNEDTDSEEDEPAPRAMPDIPEVPDKEEESSMENSSYGKQYSRKAAGGGAVAYSPRRNMGFLGRVGKSTDMMYIGDEEPPQVMPSERPISPQRRRGKRDLMKKFEDGGQ